MNQDNQVGWEKEFDDQFTRQEAGFFQRADSPRTWRDEFTPSDIKSFISRVAQDSYAEGIRRAIMDYRKAATEAKKNGGGAIEQVLSGFDALIKLEEEVKK